MHEFHQDEKQVSIFKNLLRQFSPFFCAFLFLLQIMIVMVGSLKSFSNKFNYSSLQFGLDMPNFNEVQRIFSSHQSFKTFFYADMFFVAAICLMVYFIFKKLRRDRTVEYLNYNFFKIGFLVSGAVAIISDIWENIAYLALIPNFFPSIEKFKVGAIGVFGFLFLSYLYFHFSDKNLRYQIADSSVLKWDSKRLWTITLASGISLVMLAIIALGLTFLDQGATLVVHLYDTGTSGLGLVQILVSVFFINLLSIILSHYPEYFQQSMENDEDSFRWHINRDKFLGYGIMTFSKNGKDENTKYASFVTLFRYFLGVFTYIAWFYVVYKAFDIYGLTALPAGPSVLIFSAFFLAIIYYLYRIHSRDSHALLNEVRELKNVEDDNGKYSINTDTIDKVRPWASAYLLFIVLTIVVGGASLLTIYNFGWHRYSLWSSLAFLSCNTLLYIFFRFTRLYLKFIWGTDKKLLHYLSLDKENIAYNIIVHNSKNPHTPYNIIDDQSSKWYHNLLIPFSSNYIFLLGIRFGGLFTLLYLIWAAFSIDNYISSFSAINILMGFLILLYIIIVFPLKLYFAYTSNPDPDFPERVEYYNGRKWQFVKYSFIVLAIGFAGFTASSFDNIHKFHMVSSKKGINFDQFVTTLEDHIQTSDIKECKRMIRVSSFGGGLKSNLWTLLVMNKLNETLKKENVNGKNKNILDFTTSLSGVSGGGVGVGNYLILDYVDKLAQKSNHYDLTNYRSKAEIIDTIGKENILAVDVIGLLGHDWFWQIFSTKSDTIDVNMDRAYFAMKRYIDLLSAENEKLNDELTNSSQIGLWNKMRKTRISEDESKYLPALIINTASTGNKPGVAYSLMSDEITFPGYIDLVSNENDRGLRYYDAISTTNRFPIMSPAAQVEDLGFFLDGGYFENSGLLTTEHFQNSIIKKSNSFRDLGIGTVVILNSKSDYIRHFIEENNISLRGINSSTNASAIISGLTNVDKLPHVLRKMEEVFNYPLDSVYSIYMPHPISVESIEGVMGGEIVLDDELINKISIHNEQIDAIVALNKNFSLKNNGLVVPPLARTLSEPAVDYEKMMIEHHPFVKSTINRIIKYVLEGNCNNETVQQNDQYYQKYNQQHNQEVERTAEPAYSVPTPSRSPINSRIYKKKNRKDVKSKN